MKTEIEIQNIEPFFRNQQKDFEISMAYYVFYKGCKKKCPVLKQRHAHF